MTPFFSIIVPVYKAEDYLPLCVDSILAQTYADFELILIDDGSPDGCGALCDEYAQKDSRVTAIHQENAGPTPARREGLARAQGRYICFADADDWVVPRWLETVKECLDANGMPDAVIYDYERDTGPEPGSLAAAPGYYDKARLEAELYPYMLLDLRRRPFGAQLVPGFLWNRVCRRELVTAHYLTDDRISVFEDAAMTYDVLYHAESVYITDARLYIYRALDQSNLNHFRPDFFHQVRMGYDYMGSTLGGKSPALDAQLGGFFLRKIIVGILWELDRQASLRGAAKSVALAMRETQLARDLSGTGLPWDMRLFLAALKLRLYPLTLWMVRVKM